MVVNAFNSAFMDTMNTQRAKAEFQSVKMEGGDLNAYIAEFKRLARLTGYNLQNQLVLNKFSSDLNSSLYAVVINSTEEP